MVGYQILVITSLLRTEVRRYFPSQAIEGLFCAIEGTCICFIHCNILFNGLQGVMIAESEPQARITFESRPLV